MANEVEFSILARDKFSKQFKTLDDRIKRTAKVAAGFGLAFAAGATVAAKQLIEVGNKTESLRLRINTMIGSVAEGNQVFEDMTKFASEVPFAYEEIMESATQLSGILKGGADEIAQTMPMIADLAAVSGLSISKTTEQVSRMFSAGAGAADLFRERGITAMLGFEAGVAISAEETKKKLIEAFEDPQSKFRGAADKMAKTWDGIMSMIGDKWFNIKSKIADAGMFNYFKAVATVIDKMMGTALQNTQKNAEAWSNSIIGGLRSIVDAVGFLADQFRVLEFVWEGLKLLFVEFVGLILTGFNKLANGIINIANLIPTIDIAPFTALDQTLAFASDKSDELARKLIELGKKNEVMPSDSIKDFMAEVDIAFADFQALTLAGNTATKDSAAVAARQAGVLAEEFKALQKSIGGPSADLVAEEDAFASQTASLEAFYAKKGELDANYYVLAGELAQRHKDKMDEINIAMLDSQIAQSESFGETFSLTMEQMNIEAQSLGEQTSEIIKSTFDAVAAGIGSAIATSIVDAQNLSDAMGKVLKQIAKSVIAMFIEMGVKRIALSLISGNAAASDAMVEGAKAVGLAGANGVASMAAAPFPLNLGAPAFGLAMAAEASGLFAGGIAAGKGIGATVAGVAHGGLTNVDKESTFLLDKGERVLSPNQNKDFTDFMANIKSFSSNIINKIASSKQFNNSAPVTQNFIAGGAAAGNSESVFINRANTTNATNNESGGGASNSNSVTIENINIELKNVENLSDITEADLEEFVAGPLIRTLDKLDDNGVRQRALERSNA